MDLYIYISISIECMLDARIIDDMRATLNYIEFVDNCLFVCLFVCYIIIIIIKYNLWGEMMNSAIVLIQKNIIFKIKFDI